ncbi:unnamed protein product [Paramecium sonneborni]|uniref:Uncharacterized protein n=1 Tax=Paramecium sonneborni TaxID=65129 RepID=A0A8S1Q831_9CILI|nr:unnamed protein product [Paramecium sonneborni]
MDIQNQKRKSKFSFSGTPTNEDSNTLQQFKNGFKDQDKQIKEFLSQQMLNQKRKIQNIYNLIQTSSGEILGEGRIGLVKGKIQKIQNVQKKEDGCEFACKIVKTDTKDTKVIVKNGYQNLRILKIKPSSIVAMKEFYIQLNEGFQITGTVLAVMEKVKGKEMFKVIQNQKNYNDFI